MRHHISILIVLGLMAALAPAASADGHTQHERLIAAQAGGVSPASARAAISAAERVELEMRKEGALRSTVLGCWRQHSGIDCTGEVTGNDGSVKWRCVIQIRIRKRGKRPAAKLTDAVCVAEEVPQVRKQRRILATR